MRKKRGAGRKPRGEFKELTATMSLRLPHELRRLLEQSSKQSRRSMSQEMIFRLMQSFDTARGV